MTERSFAHEKAELLSRLAAGCDNSPKGNIDVLSLSHDWSGL
jgi:hypothetical protein